MATFHHKLGGATLLVLGSFAIATQVFATEPGFTYELHHISLQNEDFSNPQEDRHAIRYVQQGSHYTVQWADEEQFGNFDGPVSIPNADYQTGLVIPWWDASLSSTDEEGWDLWGSSIRYQTFDANITKGDKADREIAGDQAQHYTLRAKLVFDSERNAAVVQEEFEGDLWIHPDKPYSPAVFTLFNAYGDPRLNTFFNEELGQLGMLVRAEIVFNQQAIGVEEDDSIRNEPRIEHLLSYVEDLKAEEVAVFNPPLISSAQLTLVQQEFREDEMQACEQITAGNTPAYFHEYLDDAQREAVIPELAAMCEELIARSQEE